MQATVAVLAADRVLELGDRVRVPDVDLAVAAPLEHAADREQVALGARIGAEVALHRLGRELVESDAADPRRGAGEVLVDQLGLEADGLEDLRAAVGLDRRDPHLRDRLQQALADRLDDPLLGLLAVEVDGEQRAVGELVERLEHQVRVDRGRAVADQRRHVVDRARLPGLDHEPGPQPRAAAHEVVVDGGDREQRRHRDALGPEVAVRQDQDVGAVVDVLGGLLAQRLEPSLHPVGPLLDRPRDVERGGVEHVVRDLAQLLELVVAQDRLVHDQLVGLLGDLGEQVDLGADAGLEAHHDRFADRVDRRVRDLREQLLEVREQRRLAVGQHRQRGVVAHARHRLLALRRHRRDHELQVLLRVAERELLGAQRLDPRRARLAVGQVVDVDDRALVPLGVRLAAGDAALDLLVLDDPALLEIEQEQLAGGEPALALDVLGRDRHHAGLRGEHDVALGVLDPAPGPQAVAVEHRAGEPAVGEHHRRRSVPRLHQAGVEVVEALDVRIEVLPGLVGLGDHHHHRVRDRAAAEHEQLEHVVERRRVRPAVADDRDDLLQVVAEQLRGELRLAGAHPVDVAAQRVDLAVVGDHPVRVGELPARERVGREAGVHERQARGDARVAQVGEVARQLGRGQHPLVDHRPAREARHRELGAGLALDHPADHVQLALERFLVLDLLGGLDHHLADQRRGQPGGVADVALVDRDVAPPDRPLALGLDRPLDHLLEHGAALGIGRQVEDADAVAAGRRQLDPDRGAHERVGDLDQDAGAVAGVRIRALGAAVLEVLERVERLLDDGMGRLAPQLRDERDAARVMLVGGVVEASGPGGSSVRVHKGWKRGAPLDGESPGGGGGGGAERVA